MRKLKKVPLFLDIEFEDFISKEQIAEVVEKVASALRHSADSGPGLAPDGTEDDSTYTKKVRIMCKDVVLMEEDYSISPPERIIQNIEGKTPQEENPLEEKCENAIDILRSILCESGNECEYDNDIYDFLKEHDELPEDYEPYWDIEDEDGEEQESAIDEECVKQVINSLSTFIEANFTEEEINETVERYDGEQEQDPSGSWNLVVEKILYDLLDERQMEK